MEKINVGTIYVSFTQEGIVNRVLIMKVKAPKELNSLVGNGFNGWSEKQCIQKLTDKLQRCNYTGEIKVVDNVLTLEV